MKPFDLDAAKRGESIITRKGYAARIICFDMKLHRCSNQETKIIALIENGGREIIEFSHDNGRHHSEPEPEPEREHPYDLCMKED